MQIGSYNPLILPGSANTAGKKDDADKARTLADAAAEAAVRVADATAVPEATPEQEAAGVVLSIQSDGSTLPKDLVYGNARQAATPGPDEADTAAMAQRYNAALERNAGSNTNLSVDSNGVLLAKPVSAGEAKAQAFVHNAVTAMRDYADAQERQKADKSPLADMQQKLAARFKLFS